MRISWQTLAILIPMLAPATAVAASSAERHCLSEALSFEPNRGQTDAAVRYLARTPHGVVFFTDRQMVLHRPGSGEGTPDGTVRFDLAGANAGAAWETQGALGETVSYHVGRDARTWVKDVPRYRRLVHRGVYPGTDAVYYGSAGRLEYDFVLAPHADPSRIRLRVTGASEMRIDADGGLVVETPLGPIRQPKPVLYQTGPDGARTTVEGAFRMIGRDEVGFTVSAYDPRLTLSIDPVLESSTYLGGSLEDRVFIANGSAVAGMTTSIDFPGAALGRRRGNDIFVSHLGTPQTTLVIGGSGDEQVTSATIMYDGHILVGGYTNSKDLPTLPVVSPWEEPSNPWQPEFAGGASDGFLLSVTRDWNSPYNSLPGVLTYVGTPGDDRVTGVGSSAVYGSLAIVGTTSGRGLLASRGQTWEQMQSEPGGGLDGFLIVASHASREIYTRYVGYFGGSGDDRPLGVALGAYGYYITGETESPDFPLVNAPFSKRSGESDAFLTLVSIYSTPKILASTLIGGSKLDKGVQVGIGSQDIVVVGTTTSLDLPLKSPLQSANGGGPSDVFLASFTPDLSESLWTTYYGGSGADEATSVATDSYGTLYVAGWTASGDFPVKNALQPKFGGGPDDGFLLQFERDGELHAATYFGGSGSDRILGLTAGSDLTAWVAGQTTSRNLPLKTPTQTALRGASDGFIAQVSTNLFGVRRVIGGKDLRASTSLTVGRLNGSSAAPVTVSSSDPGSVLVAANVSDAGRATATLPVREGYASYGRSLYVDCLVERGGADLTIAAPGYPSEVVHADCYPAKLSVYSSGNYVTQTAAGLSTSVWGGRVSFSVSVSATNPDNHAEYASLFAQPGTGPLVVRVASSNPSAGTLSAATINLTDSYGASFEFVPVAIGDTVLTMSLAKPNTTSSVKVSVVSPLTSVTQNVIPKGFQAELRLGLHGEVPRNTVVTVTSKDPAKLLISTDRARLGSSSAITAATNYGVYGQALASSGEVPVTVSVPGVAPVTMTVRLASPAVYSSAGSKPLSIGVRDTAYVTFTIGPAGAYDGQGIYSLNPGAASLRFGLDNSTPSVATVTPSSVDLKQGDSSVGFRALGIAKGTTRLTVRGPVGVPLSAGVPNTIQIDVKSKALQMSDIEVGKDLAGVMRLVLPHTPSESVQVTLTSSDPALAVLSLDNKSPGQAKLTAPMGTYYAALQFYVQGLKASGLVKITADAPGYGSVSANVRLDPSGFGWNSDSYTAVLYGSYTSSGASISAFALDAASMFPVAAQYLRAGMSAAVKVTNSKPEVVKLDGSYALSSTTSEANVPLTGKSSGDAVLSLQPVSGYSTPAARQRLNVKIQRPSLTLSNGTLAKDTQIPISISGIPSGLGQNLKATSSDPSALLLSSDPGKAGSGSITVPMSPAPVIYAQALKNQGTVNVTISSDGFNSGVGSFRLLSLGVGLSVSTNSGGVVIQDGVALTTTQSPNTPIVLYFYQINAGAAQGLSYQALLRPGFSPPLVEVKSSNTKVGVILKSPARVSMSSESSVVEFQPVAAGTADVSVVQPSGFVVPAGRSSVRFRVSLPGFKPEKLLLGKDTFVSMILGMADTQKLPDKNVTVTLTSSDPTRVLLSRDASSPAVASLTRTLVAGQRYTDSFYVHALANNGIVPIKVSAPGWADGTTSIALGDTVFSFYSYQGGYDSPLRAVLQSGPRKTTIKFMPVSQKSLPEGYGYYASSAIRPGAAAIPVTVNSSSPSVVAVDKPRVLFAPLVSTAEVEFRPVKAGQATLSLSVPAAYRVDSKTGKLNIGVEGAKLLFGNTSMPLGRDLQSGMSVGSEEPFTKAATLTVTSSDPSRLLLSSNAAAVGKGAITLTAQPNVSATIWMQALDDNGTATVTVAAAGYQSAILTVNLAPAGALFPYYLDTVNLKTNSTAQTYQVRLSTLDPSTLRESCCSDGPRAGANLSVSVSSSNTKVLKVTETSVRFPSSGSPVIHVQPTGAGTAILTLGVLPGGVPPAKGGAIVFNVTQP